MLATLLGCAPTTTPTPPPGTQAPLPPPTRHATFPAVPTPQGEETPSPPVSPGRRGPHLLWKHALHAVLHTPSVIAGGRLIALDGSGNLYALDPHSGRPLWEVMEAVRVWPRSLMGAGQWVVYGRAEGELVARRVENGEVAWVAKVEGEVQRPGVMADGVLYVGTAFVGEGIPSQPERHAWLYALDPRTGQRHWARETGMYALSTPAVANGLLVIGGGFLGPDVEEGGHLRILGMDPTTGDVRWTHESEAGFVKKLAIVGDTVIYLAYRDVIFALDAASGQPRWEYDTENWSSNFATAEGLLLFGSANAFLHAVRARDGALVWKYNLEGTFNFPVDAPQVVGDLVVFQTYDGTLYGLGLNDGSLRWRYPLGIRSRNALTVLEDGHIVVVAAAEEPSLYAFALP